MRSRFFFGLVIVAIIAISGWHFRGFIREQWTASRKPELPQAQIFQPPAQVASTSTGSVATSTKPVKPSRPPTPHTSSTGSVTTSTADILAWSGPFPASVNLAVPFLSQAPKMNWDMPYQEACEEASMIMVDAYYHGRSSPFTPEEGDRAILDLVAFEEAKGKTPDLTAQEAGQIAQQKFGYKHVLVIPLTGGIAQIKSALAHGYPVIIPADGKTIGNPNFRNGGPPYHMLVIKGYVGDKYWITNDPGTRHGQDFTYPLQHLVDVVHDWNGGDVPHGNPVMIVVLPNDAL